MRLNALGAGAIVDSSQPPSAPVPPSLPSVFDLCQPRPDVLAGRVADADFAADLASVIAGAASAEYADPARFFANTYPTRGLRDLLANVCARLRGADAAAATIFRLDTTYGGGKTHGLIALLHAAGGMQGVANAGEFVDPDLLPTGTVRIAAFDGENADPANGRDVGAGVLAYTPWGEIAYALAGSAGYERVRRSDEQGVAPGAETLRELFGGEATLILLDELAVYLRKVWRSQGAAQQLTAFLTSLFKAVEGAPNAALVYTLAVGSDGRATDAYSEENQFVADTMAEAMSVSARKATLLNPTEDAETAPVLLRRLFERVDDGKERVVNAYQALWREHRESLAEEAALPETALDFAASYPFHPDVLATLKGKTSTLSEFQRVRGMLRLLARTIAHLWQERPADATAIHLHHIDLGEEPIRQELVTRLGQSAFVPAIANDIASGSGTGGGGGDGEARSLAESIDAAHYRGLPPYAAYVARTAFLHTLAFNEPLKGIAPEQLRYAMLAPTLNISFVEEARKRFVAESAYLDDRPGALMRFLAEANLNQIIRREERNVDAGEARAELGDRIRHIFDGKTFDAVPFPGGPFDVPDEVGDGPKLLVLSYDAVSFGAQVSKLPTLVERIYARKGADGASYRALRNHLLFVATDDDGKAEMQRRARLRLALRALKRADRLRDLADHQQDQVLEMEARSEQELAIAIQQAYRHVLYPSSNRVDGEVSLAHTAIDIHSAADQPGVGQRHIVRALRELRKLRLPEDEPDAPVYVRDRTPLRKGQMTTLALRDEFRRDPALPMLIGDDTFIRGIRVGVERGDYVYQRGDLLFGPGDPPASVQIDEQAVVLTMAYAKNTGVWPRPAAAEEQQETAPQPSPSGHQVGEERAEYGVTPAAEASLLRAEGPLREALVRVWEQARDKNVERIGDLTLRPFDAGDAFRLLSVASRIAGADKTVALEGGYETPDGGGCELHYNGPLPDAQPVREFLEPQLRAAGTTHLEASIAFAFHDDGLAMRGEAPEQLAEQLCRFASGAAFVSATAKPLDGR